MKKCTIMLLSGALLVSSCTTGAGTGAYAGGSLGSVLGSAIGGIIGGPRGSDIGTVIGMAGGAVAGAAIGDANEKAEREQLHQRNQRIQRQKTERRQSTTDAQDDIYGSGATRHYLPSTEDTQEVPVTDIDTTKIVDPNNGGDDSFVFDNSDNGNGSGTDTYDATNGEETYAQSDDARADDARVEIRNVRFTDSDGDKALSGDETGKVTFEIFNDNDFTVHDIVPTVQETTGNTRIYISPSITIENIEPHQGIRYTATIMGDKRLRDGQAQLYVSANRDNRPVSYITVVNVQTKRK